MYTKAPSGDKPRNGFDLSHYYASKPAEVWPENWPSVVLFQRIGTQWRAGFGGPTGLDYTALYPMLDRMDLPRDEWLEMLDDIRAMESAALAQIAENSSEK